MQEEETTERDNGTHDLIMAKNGLMYKMPQSLSTTVDRTFKREYAQRSSYNSGDTIVFDWNTGTSYIDPNNAILTFKIAPTYSGTAPDGTEVVSFGSALGATAVIEEIRLISKNGTEIDRIQSANLLAKIQSDWTYDLEGHRNLQMALKNQSFPATGNANAVPPLTAVIPLKTLSGFFRPTVKDMLIPAGLASGMRIEITLASSAARVLHRTTVGAGTGFGYTVTEPEMLLMLHNLNDPTQSILMSESANNGLEYTFPSYFSTKLTTGQLSINEQVKKAVSQATRVFASVADVSGGGGTDVTVADNDGFRTLTSAELVDFQFRAGSSYYPQNPISDDLEAWYVATSSFGKTRSQDAPTSVALADYRTGNKFLVGVPLQTHDRLNLSGLPINNSSVLEVRMNLLNAGGLSREVTIFMEFITVARTFVNKTSIKI